MRNGLHALAVAVVVFLACGTGRAEDEISAARMRRLLRRVRSGTTGTQHVAHTELDQGRPSPASAVDLIHALRDSPSYLQEWLLPSIQKLGPAARPAVPLLLRLLRSGESDEVRAGAALALGAVARADREIVQALVAALSSKPQGRPRPDTPSVPAAAAAALGMIGPRAKDATEPLVKMVQRPGYGTVATERAAALAALGKIGPSAAKAVKPLLAIYADPDRPRLFARWDLPVALCKIGAAETVLPDVINLAAGGQDDEELRGEALTALGRIGPVRKDVVTTLLAGAKRSGERSQFYAICALGMMGRKYAKEITPVLLAVLKDNDDMVAGSAAEALGDVAVPSKPVADALAKAFSGSNDSNRYFPACMALAKLGQVGVAALADKLDDKDDQIRRYAAEALGKVGPKAAAAVGALTKTLRDRDVSDRIYAARALCRIGPASAPAVATLVTALKDRDPNVRREAARALGAIGPAAKPAVAALADLLRDDNEKVAWAAGEAFARMGPAAKAIVPAVIGIAGSRQPPGLPGRVEEALCAVSGLGEMALADLVKALKSDDVGIRVFAVKALHAIGPPAKPARAALLAALGDPSATVRGNAAKALGDVVPGMAGLTERLQAMLADKNAFVARSAAGVLSWRGPEVVEILLTALSNPQAHTRMAAATALGRIAKKPQQVVGPLIRVAGDKDVGVRGSAIDALGRFGPAAKAAVPALKRLLKDPDKYTQRTAAEALWHIEPKERGP